MRLTKSHTDLFNYPAARSSHQPEAPAQTGQEGFILIAAVALLTTLLGVVLLCLYPLAHEARQAPRHREALRRLKAAEQGLFGRLADQPGGEHAACGGYFSDLGPKVIVAEVMNEYGTYQPVLESTMEFWWFRKQGNLPVLKSGSTGLGAFGYTDIYRYDQENGFWVGYRGKRYVARPIGDEHMRKDYDIWGHEVPAEPRFTDGFMGYWVINGDWKASEPFLYVVPAYVWVPAWAFDFRLLEHRRYFNPVEKLVVRVHDHRAVPTPLSARLIYARQRDPESITDPEVQRLPPYSPPELVVESPQTSSTPPVTTFVFLWEPVADPIRDNLVVSGIGREHTFEIGLKKLVLLENGVPVFACGITIPPVRDYQCRLMSDSRFPLKCKQTYYDQYVVEVDYDG